MFLSSLLATLLSVCMLLSARAAVMLPYNVEWVLVQRAWETLSAEHPQSTGPNDLILAQIVKSRFRRILLIPINSRRAVPTVPCSRNMTAQEI